MIKLMNILRESLLSEYNKSQLDYILFKLDMERDDEFNSLMNALDAQGIKYPELKDKIIKGKIKSFDDLKALKTQSKSDVSKAIKSDVKKILDNENFLIIQPKTFEANCYYGANTKWCTTMTDDEEEGREHFKDYKKYGLTFIIDKSKSASDPLHKVAISIHKCYSIHDLDEKNLFFCPQVSNAKDDQISDEEYVKYLKTKGVDTNIINAIFYKK